MPDFFAEFIPFDAVQMFKYPVYKNKGGFLCVTNLHLFRWGY